MEEFIIVANGKTEEIMAKRIHAIISQKENFEALCWTEKQYNGSAQTISSSQYCLFIGETSEYKANNLGGGIEWKYNQYGMKYGWIGRKGFLLVDKKEKLSADQKQELSQKFSIFFEDAKKGIKEIEDKNKTEESGKNSKVLGKLLKNKGLKNGALVGAGAAVLFPPLYIGVLPALLIGGAIGGALDNFDPVKFVKQNIESPKFNEYRYVYLVNEFCKEGLNSFLGVSEENNKFYGKIE